MATIYLEPKEETILHPPGIELLLYLYFTNKVEVASHTPGPAQAWKHGKRWFYHSGTVLEPGVLIIAQEHCLQTKSASALKSIRQEQ